MLSAALPRFGKIFNTDKMSANIIDGLLVAAKIQAQVKQQVDRLVTQGIRPCLSTILIGENPASISYVNKKQRAAAELGIATRDLRFSEAIQQKELEGSLDLMLTAMFMECWCSCLFPVTLIKIRLLICWTQ
jgi:methylenetetrahydrofolate dehydrogenase (NADP+)/methenyltetrahydrofolate cyclohydrolase